MNAEWNYSRYRHASAKISLQWRYNGRDSVSNHQPHNCLLNHLFRCRSKKTSKLHVTGLCVGNSPGTGAKHKWPVTRKMFPFDHVIMLDQDHELHFNIKTVFQGLWNSIIKKSWSWDHLIFWLVRIHLYTEAAPPGLHLNIRIIFTGVQIPILKMRQLWRKVLNFIMRIPSHYLRRCWPRSMLPYDITRPQWVKGYGLVPMAYHTTIKTFWKTLWKLNEYVNDLSHKITINHFFLQHIFCPGNEIIKITQPMENTQ